ncbi:hypothetical protein [Solidesulfovibrio sp.]
MTDPAARLGQKARAILLARIARTDDAGRAEALTAFVGLSRPDLGPDAAGIIAATAPRLLPELTEKWVGLFVDRLLETVPLVQIEELCNGSADNEAALALAYVMFLESERMEKQMAEDLAACNRATGREDSGAAAEACRQLALAEERRRQASLDKAAAYRRSRSRSN